MVIIRPLQRIARRWMEHQLHMSVSACEDRDPRESVARRGVRVMKAMVLSSPAPIETSPLRWRRFRHPSRGRARSAFA